MLGLLAGEPALPDQTGLTCVALDVILCSIIIDMLEFANCRFDIRSQDEDSPIGRWGHTSCVLKDEILFFGGEAEECTEMNGIEPLLVLNVNNYSFNQIFVPGGPRSRDSHICVVVKDKLFVWGGCHNKQVLTPNDLALQRLLQLFCWSLEAY